MRGRSSSGNQPPLDAGRPDDISVGGENLDAGDGHVFLPTRSAGSWR